MARRKQNYPLIEGLEITTLAAEGKAMGRWQDQVVFVPMTVPGDLVDVQIRNRRRRFMEGTVVRYVHRSPLRVEPFCAHFGVCGGCKWQNLPYAKQLRFKTEQVRDIEKCWLQPEPSNALRNEIKRFALEHGYSFHNIREHAGLMRNLIVRTASTGEVMAIVVFGEEDTPRIEALMSHVAERFPQITSLFYVINTKWNDSLADLTPVLYRGKDHILEQMEGLRFKVGPKSFYQTNSAQAYELYKVARDFAALTGGETLYDLYTGTGTIANFCAARCAKVVGVEYVPEAIDDAKVNSALNGIGNTRFYAGDMKAVLDDAFVAANGRPDVIILDPPRAGVDQPVIDVILRAAPERIVYVSCNPATQARDLALMDGAYRVEAVQPVDMFPHTHHVENVVKLVRR